MVLEVLVLSESRLVGTFFTKKLTVENWSFIIHNWIVMPSFLVLRTDLSSFFTIWNYDFVVFFCENDLTYLLLLKMPNS